jgi:hypothetical protein
MIQPKLIEKLSKVKIRQDLFENLSAYLMTGIEPQGIVRAVVCNNAYSLLNSCETAEDFLEAQKIFVWLDENGTIEGLQAWGSHAIMHRYLDNGYFDPLHK